MRTKYLWAKKIAGIAMMSTSFSMLTSLDAARAAIPADSIPMSSLSWIEDSLNVNVSADGFNWISQIVSEQNLQDIRRQPVPDVDEDMGYGIQGYVTGITYDIDFNRFDISPGEQNIAVHLRFNSIAVRGENLEFKKRVGVVLKTKCKDIELSAGQSSPVDLFLVLKPVVQDGKIHLVETGLQFDIDESNFNVSGPDQCSGSLGIGNVIGSTVHKILERSRERIVDAIRDRVRSTIPKIEDQINNILLAPIPLNIGNAALKDHPVMIKGRMKAISAHSSGLDATMDISAEQSLVQDDPFDRSLKNQPGLLEVPFDATLASVALKTQLLNQLFQYAVPSLTAPTVVATDNPPASQIFNRSALSAVLPDLNQIVLDSESVGLRVGFGLPPTISTQTTLDGSIDLTLNIPDLHLLLDVAKDGKPTPYFDVKIATVFGVRITKDPGSKYILLTVQNPRGMTVTGTWDPAYKPKIDIFESDVAQILFKSALDYLFVAQPVFKIKSPEISFGSAHYLDIAYPFMNSETIGIALGGK